MCVFHECIRSLTISDSVYSSRCLLAARFSSNFISLFLQYKSANKSSYHPKLQPKKKTLTLHPGIHNECVPLHHNIPLGVDKTKHAVVCSDPAMSPA